MTQLVDTASRAKQLHSAMAKNDSQIKIKITCHLRVELMFETEYVDVFKLASVIGGQRELGPKGPFHLNQGLFPFFNVQVRSTARNPPGFEFVE